MSQMTEVAPTLEGMKSIIQDANVDVEKLGVVMWASEQLFGEVIERKFEPYHHVVMKDPKRILRLQQVQPGNFRVDFILVDLDLMESGRVELQPMGFYLVRDLDEDSQHRMLGLYLSYLENKQRSKAAEAGIVIPDVRPPANVRATR